MSIEIVENERQQYVMIPHNVTINSGLFILKILDTEKRSFCHETKDPESKSHLFMVVYIHETLCIFQLKSQDFEYFLSLRERIETDF